ncbi:MAG: SH3 domain-containing protein [Nitrospinales bacterium]
MPFTSTSYTNLKRRQGRKIICRVCKQTVPVDSLVCQVCDAPELPDPDPSQDDLTLPKTLLRIAVMVIICTVYLAFKAGVWFGDSSPETPPVEIKDTEVVYDNSTGVEIETIHVINVAGANIRAEPSIAAKRIAVLPIETRVKVLKTHNDWSQINANGTTGWVASRLLVLKDQAVE